MRKNANIYHQQAEVDRWAKDPDLKTKIIEATMQQIIESYNEYLDELRLEAQEAY